MSLEKHVNRLLNLKINEHLLVGNGQTGIYANRRWIDENSKRVVIYYYDAPYDPNSRELPNFIRVKGIDLEIEYWQDQRPTIANAEEKMQMYERAKKKKSP